MPAPHAAIEADLNALRSGSAVWGALSLHGRAALMRRLRLTVAAEAAEWARIANETKGLSEAHPLRGEEWISGPYTVLASLGAYERTLRAIAAGHSPLDGIRVIRRAGQLRAQVFPADATDRNLLRGFRGEVWLKPGVDSVQARQRAGLAQLDPAKPGGIGLVLGAGNITSIPVLDVVYELLSANRVVMLKINPTQEPLLGVFQRVLRPLIEPGFLRIVTGDGEVGAFLTSHEAFSHVHITGAAATFDAIVWGTGDEAARRRAAADPRLQLPITGELGGVAPIIVVPGEWTQADLDFQAEHIVTMRLQNSGHNCIAGQVVLVSGDWAQRDAFLTALRRAWRKAPTRPVWYPNSAEKFGQAVADYPDTQPQGDRLLVEIPRTESASSAASALEQTEYFAPVLGVVELTGTGQAFLDAAVEHANERLAGTLGANVIIDPDAQAELGDGFDRSIQRLRYGNIAINAWTGFSFTAPTLSWGGVPGHTLEDVGSGIGIVHNALLLDDVERSVLTGPFRPFPRALRGGRFTILPKPPWFVTSRTGAQVSEGFTRFRMDKKLLRLAKTMLQALRS